MKDLFGYKGKNVVVTGSAGSGMGANAVSRLIDLGAHVYALDLKEVTQPVAKYIKYDQGKKDEIEKAAGQLPETIDCLFNCAALPGPPFSNFDTMIVNFVGLRHLTESLVPRIKSGGAIAIITSAAGRNWQQGLSTIKELLRITDWDASVAWVKAHENINTGYRLSKECLVAYTKFRAIELARKGIRVNCINPGPTSTPMMTEFFSKYVPKEKLVASQGLIGRDARPEEMAEPMLFLNSAMAGYISGVDLDVDYGIKASMDIAPATK